MSGAASALPIAIVMRAFEPGGTERQMIELVRRLDPVRWRVHLACFRLEGRWLDRATERAASVKVFPVRSFRRAATFRHVRAFAEWCRGNQIQVVQATELPSNLFALPAAALAGVPVRVGARREINPNKTPFEIAAQRAAYGFATKVVANSHAAAARLRLECVAARRIAVVPNGLDAGDFIERPPRLPMTRIVTVANLRPEKRHDLLIEAAPLVLRRHPLTRFHIVGDGPERSRLEAQVAATDVAGLHGATGRLSGFTGGLTGAFRFLGHVADVPRALADGDLFVLPSRSEGFPNAVLEAMAAGLPVVATALDSIREIVDDGRTGLLVAPNDARALGEAICRVFDEPSQALAMAERAKAEVRERYSFDRMVRAFESLYAGELARRQLRSDTVAPALLGQESGIRNQKSEVRSQESEGRQFAGSRPGV